MTFEPNKLAEKVSLSSLEKAETAILLPFSTSCKSQNQLVCFLKPEVFLVPSASDRRAIVELVLGKMPSFGVSITGAAMIAGGFLERASVMDRHYGFINAVSRGASTCLNPEDLAAARAAVGADVNAPVIGGHEFLAQCELSPQELDLHWQTNTRSVRVRSGLYAKKMQWQGMSCVVVNGFHPAQLAHFTAPDRQIALFLCETDMPWSFVRNRLVGDTFPEKAARGSIRRDLHDNAERLGLGKVDIANNCIHMSAGPFEGYFEIGNFLKDLPGAELDLNSSAVANTFRTHGVASELSRVVGNPGCELGSLFDLTEGVDTFAGAHLFKTFFAGSTK